MPSEERRNNQKTFQDPHTELYRIEQRFRDIAEVASDWFWETDSELRFTYISNRFYEVSSIHPKEVIGKTRIEFISDHERKAYPQKWKKHEDDLLRQRSFHNLEYRVDSPDGTPCYIRISGKPYYNQDGLFSGYRGAGSDITAQKVAEKALIDSKRSLEDQVNSRTHKLRQEIAERKQVEQALRESEAKYRQLFEKATDAIFIVEKSSGRYLDANAAAENLSGYALSDLKKMTTRQLTPEGAQQRLNKIGSGSSVNDFGHVAFIRPDGSKRIARLFAVPINADCVFGIAQDVTERRHAEEALRKSHEKHRKLVSTISDVIVIMDNEGVIKYKSSNITEQFGWHPNELIGKHGLFTVHNDDKERIGNELTRLLKRNNAKTTVEYKYQCKDGSFKPVELTAVNKANDPIINGVLANYKDITERKISELQLKQSEEKYRTMVERSNDMIWTLDTTGNFTFFNKQTEEVTGLKLNEWLGKSFVPLIIEEDLPMIMDIFQQGIEGQSAHYELRFRKTENEILTISVNTAPLIKDGRVSGLVSFGRDITEQKLAEKEKADLEAQLQQSQKMEAIGTLAGGIAHDFNNILSGIFGYTQLLQMKMQNDSDMLVYLDSILNAGNRAKDLVAQILTFSRQSAYELNPIEIQLVLKETLKLIESSVPSTISINKNIQNNCGAVLSDTTQIHQIIMNLCTNAYQAMEESGGELTVALKEVVLTAENLNDQALNPGKYVQLTVADTGTGIDRKIIGRIFDPYFTTKKEGKGTGLGLSVIHGIVKSHRGQIRVDSEPGKGAEFQVYLPVIKAAKEPAYAAVHVPIQKGTERILLVDDQKDVIDIEQQMLEMLGYQVTTKTSSMDALDTFRANPDSFDLAITDMTMPNMTGDNLAGELMKIRADIPIILCTGFSEKISEKEAVSLGIKGFLMKPVVLGDLSVMIRKVLDVK